MPIQIQLFEFSGFVNAKQEVLLTKTTTGIIMVLGVNAEYLSTDFGYSFNKHLLSTFYVLCNVPAHLCLLQVF
jgi:hypothetical protein